MCEADIYAPFKAFYEVVDITGFKDKDGKWKRNVPCYWPVSLKQHNSLKTIIRQMGKDFTRKPVQITQEGTGKSKSITVLPARIATMPKSTRAQFKRLFQQAKKVKSIAADFGKYYKPPSLEEAKIMAARALKDQD